MAERRGLLTEETQGTVLAVCFVLALLATGFGVYNLVTIRAMSQVVAVHNLALESNRDEGASNSKRIDDLEKKLAELDKRAAAMAAAPGAPGDGGPPPEGKAGKGSKNP